ncbi:hypothetical protein [Arcobacter sp. LA11]|uniref:hypothetical protein n=1 Tax=Arcobacter sp. LA11 TaxID=1898176 RepID=UPI00093400B9|nr:hypothetical protein [Arcobacter sp. LA11]
MNFENYNNIYKEILDDETGDLSANYLLNKYEIKHEEELLNILNQIKKNEYISSDNKIINRLINELDEDDNLLDINEIINIKDKVINVNEFDLQNEEPEEKIDIETDEIIKDKSEKSQNIINETTNKKNYFLYIIPIVLLGLVLFFFNSSEEEKTEKTMIVKNEKVIEEEKKTITAELKEEKILSTEIEEKKTSIETPVKKVEEVSVKLTNEIKEDIKDKDIDETEKVVKENVSNDIENTIEKTSNSEATLNKIEESTKEILSENKSTIKLKSLDQISKYVKKLKVEDNKLLFEGNYYSENNDLFGFKIFKITPLYVKFEDENKNIRKRFLIKK